MAVVANKAILFNRRMLEFIWATFIGVTFITELVGRRSFKLVLGCCSVGIVAIKTSHFTLEDRVVRSFLEIIFYFLMASKTCFRCWHSLICRYVDIVAIYACDIIFLVITHIPEGKVGRI